ncbi:uncharacterized protein CXQ87_004530 [Candidozyma duobushaemuli]|uniref:Protein kinase domain-containing protein n=1 Tax=Candidozyma duobushaemuli TaxID=1231522 RepID=A0A2V1AGZ8_9ASCO|nr:uncharacterized protein CXQ87_004530 [[Candida] duobushaemulonis]PVH16972.1 hypothetical protein CXQ87_004530 [[Candida] duobushaemulonis]
MGLFSRKDRSKSPKPPLSSSQTPQKQKSHSASPNPENKPASALAPPKPSLPRQISTEHANDFAEDEEDQETDDSDYEPHMHTFLPRDRPSVSQLSTLMGYCGIGSDSKEGLQKAANEESKRTFSLLDESFKITRLSPTMSRNDKLLEASIIDEAQVSLINRLKEELNAVIDIKGKLPEQYSLLQDHKTLHQRYGAVKDVVGRGAYGVIKLIDSGEEDRVYAVKELQKRTQDNKTEPTDKFIDRVISEFILSSALNNKNIVRTVDLMVTLPPIDSTGASLKVNQVMVASNGGTLFAYLKKCVSNKHYVSIDDIDCMIKQIARGLWYMHQHGVAHCDLKLENILIDYDESSIQPGRNGKMARMNLKISDFGKSSVFRTKWDSTEQFWPASNGPIGSEPLSVFGVLILVLYNVRRHYFCGTSDNFVVTTYYDKASKEEDSRAYGSTYLWKRTDLKPLSHKKYRDSVFDEYVHNAMVADYNSKTQEWTIKKEGSFIPIETLFDKGSDNESDEDDSDEEGFEESDYEIRRLFIYKLLDMNPSTRLTVDDLLSGAWINDVESCA